MRELIGSGILIWDREERRSNRYGSVALMNTLTSETAVSLITKSENQHGRLVAVVKEARQSHHIGDRSHKVFPSMPSIGEEVVLGEGTVFFKKSELGHVVGLRPDDGRDQLWLDIQGLYRVHEQTVDLFFE